jgi:hypothetical protein
MVEGPVDRGGLDPATTVVARATASQVGADGSWSVTWRPSGPAFIRAQVRDSAGRVIGIGNPCFVLPESSRGTVPSERLHG